MALQQNSEPNQQDAMEQHIPIHPLPEEIQKMSRDETVCKYCGVSYLILHEFKLMEEKLKALETEMELYHGSVERERRLKEELQALSQSLEWCKADADMKTERLQNMGIQLANKQEELQGLNIKLHGIHSQLKAAQTQSQIHKVKWGQHKTVLRKTYFLLQHSRKELTEVKEEVLAMSVHWGSLNNELLQQVHATCRASQAEITELNVKLKKSQQQTECLQDQNKDLQLVSEAAVQKDQQLQASLQREAELQNRCQEQQKQTLDLNSQLKALQLNLQKVTYEMEKCKDMLMSKTKEIEGEQSRLRRLELEKEVVRSRYSKEVQEKEEASLLYQEKCKYLMEKLAEKEREEEESKRKTSLSESELKMLETALGQAKEELSTLKQERELMMISHQNKIEQLRESIRQKMANGDSWRGKVETELAKERAQRTSDLHETVLKLKEEARMEVDIERQKYQELIKKYLKEKEELQAQVPSLLAAATKTLQEQVNHLELKLQEARSRLTERADSKDLEIQSLKKVVTELESRLHNEQNNIDVMSEELRKETQSKSEEMRSLSQELEQLTEQLNQAQEENCFLQETVRRECEERYELTEALSQAREQLLELKKLGGGRPFSQQTLSPGSLRTSSVSSSTRGQKGASSATSEKGARFSSLYGLSGNSEIPYSKQTSNNGSTDLPAIPLPRPPRERTSGNEARHRIAAALRRK
nr:PREDICTED: leucine-, glutamate- and lysine-rich protein 1 isoform X1 [Latimeria chalumnae]|eukprot:XP_005987361.1 PREDICTED: leucine-, glutamate- and lysine-rich protein 1 isoform X1 [Latimeria chalumnae]